MRIISIISKLFTFFNTLLLKKKFKKFGKGSRIKWGSRILNPHNIEIGDNVLIEELAWLNAGHKDCLLKISDGVHIGRLVHINCYNNVFIGKNVLIGPNVFIGDSDHSNSELNKEIIFQKVKIKNKIRVGEGSFIAKDVNILSGCDIGKNTVVSSNAVIQNCKIDDFSLVVGSLATIKQGYYLGNK